MKENFFDKIKELIQNKHSKARPKDSKYIHLSESSMQCMDEKNYSDFGEERRPDYYLKKIIFNDGTALDLNQNDIIVFVGENNVGKSRALQDLHELLVSSNCGIVLKGLELSKPSTKDLLSWCRKNLVVEKRAEDELYSGVGVSRASMFELQKNYFDKPNHLRDIFVCKIDALNRLTISVTNEPYIYGDKAIHPLQNLLDNKNLQEEVSDKFHEAFGFFVFPYVGLGTHVSLCVYDKPDIHPIEHKTQIEFLSEYLKIMNTIPKLYEQGDGMRSFAGLILYLIIERYNLFLIDEPEAFLHPPQASILGGMVGDLLGEERQAIIATHSINFINGLLENCPNRVKIVRITRSSSGNSFSVLKNDKLNEISKDPFLKHSLLLNGLFYKNVVLCEGDVDCMFFSVLNSAKDMKGAKGSDTLFIHCGGKQRMEKVLWSLKELNVEVKVVTDFDILNDKVKFRKLVEACGGAWAHVETNYKILEEYIKGQQIQGIKGKDILQIIQSELNGIEDKELSPDKIKSIRKLIKAKTIWDDLKNKGLNGIESPNVLIACRDIFEYLKTIGLHIVPCGELEQFIPEVEGHGTSWLNAVQENYPDVSDGIYNLAKDFIRSLSL